jgi:hypothetical protein
MSVAIYDPDAHGEVGSPGAGFGEMGLMVGLTPFLSYRTFFGAENS